MVSTNLVHTLIGIIGNITAGVLFMSTVPTFYGIWKKKTVEQYSPIPYLATFINCGLWTLYGLPWIHPNAILVITINGSGFLLEFVYLLLFIMYSERKQRLRVLLIMLVELGVLVLLGIGVSTFAHTTKVRSNIIGSIAVAGNILMYAAPLSVMKLVITTKSVEYMPFLLSLFCFLNGVTWVAYGLIKFDPFIVIPNSIGTFFAIIQLILYATFYKSTQRLMAERKAQAEVSLSAATSRKIGVDP